MNLSEIRGLARTLLSEPTASYWSDTELNTYINLGLEDFCSRTNCLEGIKTQSTATYQADYDLPTDYSAIKRVEYVRGNSIYLLEPADLSQFFTGTVRVSNTAPDYYNMWDGQLRLSNRLSNPAETTTLNGGITASATTITLTDSSGFPRMGRITIDSECIAYYDNTSNVLSACIRGVEGTTAAVHTTTTTVSHRDLWTYYCPKDTELTSDLESPTIPSQFHKALAYYCASIGRRKSKDHDLADKYDVQYEKSVGEAIDWVKFKWKRVWQPK